MSYEDDLYDQSDEASNDSNLVKKLRSKIDELAARAKELESENQNLKGSARKQTLSAALASRGFPAKIAAFIPADIEPTDEAIDEWLNEYGDVFGGAVNQDTQEQAVQQAPVVVASAADAEAYRRMSAAETGAEVPGNISGDILAQIDAAESMDDLMAVLRG
jgi:hypothetical protein